MFTELQIANKGIIVRYLTGATTVAALRTFVFDEIEPERRHPMSLTFLSDGQWIWSGVTAYYVERYDVRLPQDFLQCILESGDPFLPTERRPRRSHVACPRKYQMTSRRSPGQRAGWRMVAAWRSVRRPEVTGTRLSRRRAVTGLAAWAILPVSRERATTISARCFRLAW